MTLLEYVTFLQDQGLSDEEVKAKAQEWKKKNQPKEEKVEVETKEEVKEPAVAEKDTTVTAETTEVSEPLDSGDGELTSQEIKPGEFAAGMSNEQLDAVRNYQKQYETIAKTNEVYSPEGDEYEYKFSVNEEGNLDYLTRKKGEEDFIKASELAEFSIADTFGHLNEDQKKELELYKEQLKKIQEEPGTVTLIETDPKKKNLAVRAEDGGFYVPQKELPKASTEDAMKNFEKRTGKKPSSLMELTDEDYIIQDPTLLESSITESLILQNKQKVVQIRETLKGIKANTYRSFSNLLRVPTYINEMIFTAIADDKTLELYNSLDVEKRQQVLNKMVGMQMPVNNANIVNYLQKTSSDFKQKSDAINETMVQYDETIGDLFGEAITEADASKAWDATVRMSSEALKSIPSLIQAMVPYVGIGSIVAGEAAGSSLEKQEEGEDLSGKLNVNSLIHGASEGILETVTRGIAKRAFKAVPKESKEQAIKSITQMALQIAKDFGLEGLSESATLTINNLADSAVLGDEKAWEGYLSELIDTFLIGGALGGKIAATGAAKQVITQTSQANQVNKIVKDADLNNVTEFYIAPKVTENSIKLSQNPVAKIALDKAVQAQIDAGEISVEKGNEIKNNFRQTEGAVNTLNKLNISEASQPAMVDLMIEQKTLEQKIKEVDNSSLTKEESTRLKEIDAELNNLVTQDKISKNIEGAKAFAEGLEGVGLENVKGTEDLISSVEAIEANGGEVIGLARDENGNILPAEDQNYGFISRMGDGTTQVILNEVSALKDNVATTAQHEVLHALLDKIFVNNSAAKIEAGKKLEALLNSDGIELDAVVASRLNQADKQFKDGEISEEQYYEEIFTLTSEGLSNDQIVENKTLLDKFTDFGRTLKSIFSGGKLNISFRTGRSALDFVKGYNKAIKSGKGADVAAKTGIIKGTEVTGKGPARQSEKAVRNKELIQNIKDGDIAAANTIVQENSGLILDLLKFNPDVAQQSGVDSSAVLQAVTDMMTPGMVDITFPGRKKSLAEEYTADSGEVSTFLGRLRQRAAEIYTAAGLDPNKFATESLSAPEARQVAAKEPSAKPTVRRKAKTTPKASRKYPSTVLSNLGVSTKAEVDALFEKAIADDIANFYDVDITEFRDTKDIGPAVAALMEKATGLKANRFSSKAQNIMKGDVTSGAVTNLQQLLLANAAADFAMMADAANIDGKSTLIPGKILNALFTKNAEDKWIRNPKKGLKDYINIIEALNPEAKRAKGKEAIYRSADAQALKGLASLSIRNLIFEQAVPDPVARTRTGARFSTKQIKQRKNRFEVSGADGIKVMRNVAKQFAAETNTKVIVDGKELTADNFNSKNPQAVKYLKNKLENELWKFMPLESLTKGSMVDYSSKGDRSFFFDKNQYDEILKNAKKNRDQWIKEGNKLEYDLKSVNVAKAAISPVKNIARYLTNFSKAAKQKIKQNNKGVESILQGGANAVKQDSSNYLPLLAIFGTQSDSTSHVVRNMAVDVGVTEAYVKEKTPGTTVKEHVEPSNEMAPLMFESMLFDEVSVLMPVIEKVYYQLGITKIQDGKLSDVSGQFGEVYNYITTQVEFFQEGLKEYFKTGDISKIPDPLVRYFNPQVNKNSSGDGIPGFNANEMIVKGKTVAEMFTFQLPKSDQNPVNIFVQNDLTHQVLIGEITQAKAVELLKEQVSTNNLKSRQSKKINNLQPNNIKFEGEAAENSTMVVDELNKLDKALAEGRKIEKPVKKIRVFDFDDTLAKSKSKVIVTLEDGTVEKINATEFAKNAEVLIAEGAQFDFTEFEQVIEGKKGPLFNVAKKIADARGTEDLFILTARPQSAAGPIKSFMKALGINIPLKNITGLADGTPAAKARWIAGKATEGYNDFYFADDATKNVAAVKEILDQIDVKSRVQQARASKKQTFDTVINDMIESSSGIESYKKFSAAKAKTIGRDKGRFDFLTLASSAEDFKGLLYRLIGDGKKGEAQFEFLKTNLIDPYNRAEDAIVQAKISAANDFMALKEQFKGLPKTLETETGVGKFTYQHALRVYMWTKQDMSIPGLSKADARKLNKFITDDAQLQAFADQLISIQKGKPYPEPGKDWLGGNLTTDIIGGINKVNRAEYQQQWRENVEIIFSPENLNKMEAAYGTRWRNALENSLKRMKAGTNRLGYNDATSAILDWVNNSVGAVMFLNTRSAVLQTISAVNFINWGDNNIIKAGAAFANQKQFWSDFMTLMNSDYLTQRRNGLKINVSESEIADAVKDSKNKVKAAIAYLLSKGFVFTRYADSFAIASGGATFYRNRIKKYLKEGMSQELAQEKAFNDFRDVAEESQQSSSPDKISMQQASAAGRVILNWANTPMQYVRIQKRALQDLIAGRGDAKVHISRIAYYGVMQNLIFNALQQALFAIGFGDDDEEDEKKKKAKDKKIARVANGMIDSQLKGLGIAGAAMVAAKNTLMKIYEESEKKTPEFEKAAIEALSFSPAISSKYRKIVGGLKSFSWNRKEMKEKGFSLDNPAYLAGAQIVTAFTNIPLDRVVKKINNIRGIMSEQSQAWQKVSMSLGWSAYDVGLPYYGGWDKPKEPTEAERKQQEIDVMKRDTNTAEQTQMLLDFGLTKKEIKALRYEDARVKKIIELQKKKKNE